MLSITLWNVMWAKADSPRGAFFRRRLAELSSSVICLTEGYAELMPAEGHVIMSQPDYGYPLKRGRRKVLLWSREPWHNVDPLGSSELPAGRFVAGTTDTPIGAVRFLGVCVPWRDAHVRTGRQDRRPWQDHLTYLQQLGSVLAKQAVARPAILLGDMNQRVPRKRQPRAVFDALSGILAGGFDLATGGQIPGTQAYTIDHLAATRDLTSAGVEHLDCHDENNAPMSDHFGLRVSMQRTHAVNKVQ